MPTLPASTSGHGSGMDFVRSLPWGPTPEREQRIVTAVLSGCARILWTRLTVTDGARQLDLSVMEDALAVGHGDDFVRVPTTCRTAQRVADLLGASLLTTRIADAIWAQGAQLAPTISPPGRRPLPPDVVTDLGLPPGTSADMADTPRSVEVHRRMEKTRAGRAGLLANVGKHWVLTNRLEGHLVKAANYGFFDRRSPNGKVWQPLGLAHDTEHTDYSQTLVLVARACTLDGASADLLDVMQDPSTARLVSDEGPMRVLRHPGVR